MTKPSADTSAARSAGWQHARDVLARAPRRGWIGTTPSPVTRLAELAAELQVADLWAKRDDMLPALHGGTKIRKLDHLLATPRFADAHRWMSVGAIGSGHLTTLVSAAAEAQRVCDVHLFWEPPSERVLANLAYTASSSRIMRYSQARWRMALRRPWLVLAGQDGRRYGSTAVVPPGATSASGMLGLVLGGLELAQQIEAGELPVPDRLVVPLGSGGTCVGLAYGLALAGLPTVVHAVSVVERMLSTRHRLVGLGRIVRHALEQLGVQAPGDQVARAIVIDRSAFGKRYGQPTPASVEAVNRLNAFGLPLEAVYSGTAMAALFESKLGHPGENVLFWVTGRRNDPLPAHPDWWRCLPRPLFRRLQTRPRRLITRRRFVIGCVAAAGTVGYFRFFDYPALPNWNGKVLSEREALVLMAAAEALLPPAPIDATPAREVAVNVDNYLVGMPGALVRDVHMLLMAVEQATTPLSASWSRMSGMSPPARAAYLELLNTRGGLQRQMYRGIRDLCMSGYYQRPGTWPALGYEGPMVPAKRRPSTYDKLVAVRGELPRTYQVSS